MDVKVWDDVIIGAGIIGSWTAYHLSKNGRRVLLLDQFPLPHTRGSSHGLSRLTRLMHEEEIVAVMMEEINKLWHQLEEECGQSLMKNTQMLIVDSEPCKVINTCMATAVNYGHPYHHLTSDQLQSRYPMLRYSDQYQGLLDPGAGLLIPERCLGALRHCVVKNGGSIQDGVQVQDVRPGQVAMVMTNKGNFQTRNVILTTGPWSKEILLKIGLQLPIKTMAGIHAYWKLKDPTQHNAENSPVVVEWVSKAPFYLFPSMEYPGLVKVGVRLKEAPIYCHPDERDKKDISLLLKEIHKYMQEHFPGVESEPSIIEPCMYTNTPDCKCFLDRHPVYHNIIIGTGFSGDGFTLSPAVGKLLCELAMGTEPSYDITPFRINRFRAGQGSKL